MSPACLDHSYEKADGGSIVDEASVEYRAVPVSGTLEDVEVEVVAPGSELVEGHTSATAVADSGSILV